MTESEAIRELKNENEQCYQQCEGCCSEGRVTKLVHKMVDEGIIPEDWDEHDREPLLKISAKKSIMIASKRNLRQ